MILSWFDATEAKKFGDALAHFFVEKIPPAAQIGDKAFAQKSDKVIHQMADQVSRFKLANKLNTYKKAQIGSAFKWTLIDAGVAPEYADDLTKWLMLRLG